MKLIVTVFSVRNELTIKTKDEGSLISRELSGNMHEISKDNKLFNLGWKFGGRDEIKMKLLIFS